jgi:hypothetical protein
MIKHIKNNDEKIVYDYFVSCGFTNIAYEPDGNNPPDFLINGTIAVEVRCLNQNHFDGTGTKGLEEVAIPLWDKIKNLLENYQVSSKGQSWLVHYKFSRPVESWQTLKSKIQQGLDGFIASSNPARTVIAKGYNFELEVICQTLKTYPTMFVMGGCIDQDSGGLLLSKMGANIQYCVNEKDYKINRMRAKYSTWWLALVDHIGYSLDDFEREMFLEKVSIQYYWDKVVLIDPRGNRRWFEI